MAESSESGAGKISLKIKTTAVQYDIEVPEGATVSEVKQALVDKTGNPVEKHTLIFSGKILKDSDTLAQHSIKDGMAIHLVIRTTAPAAPAPAAAPSATPSTPQPAASVPSAQPQQPRGPFGGLPGMGAAGGMNPMAMMQNPEMMQQMMNSPIMQSIMSNPQIMRSMLAENPQMQQLIESNPELGHILNDPEMMRQTMEMMRNPNMFNEMMRNHDQAIRNLQGIPGGEAALQRLYQDVQEPLLNSATSSFGGNPFAALSNNANTNTTSRSQNAGVENAEALPNPWGGGGAAAGGAAGGAQAAQGGAARGGGMGAMMEQMMQQMGGGGAGGLGGAGANDLMGMMNNPAMRQMAAQMAQGLASNPETAGLLGGVPPSVLTAMGNPRIIDAMMQIQTGMEVIRREAPELARDMFGQSAAMMDALRGAPGAAAAAGGAPAADGAAAGGLGGINPALLNSLFANMQMGSGMGGAPAASREQLEAQYATQLETLQGMGFTNVAENLAALAACFGDVNMAIERLLQR